MFDEFGDFKRQLPDRDPEETNDWVHSLDSVIADEGKAFRKILRRHVKSEAAEDVVLAALKQTLIIDRAYRAGLGFVMNQIPENQVS